ncbi:MAG TPA: hypothetical protein VNS88_12520 [Nitrospiraceae bacterium]|nr:hypothetical protein [Nitrospiraceae bacterium]
MKEDTGTEMSVPGVNDPDTPIYIPPGMMHRDEANFMSIDRRGEPRNLFPHFVAIAALIAIIVICIM